MQKIRSVGEVKLEESKVSRANPDLTRVLTGLKRQEGDQSIPDRFEQQVTTHPHQIAVKTKRDAFTYEQLNKAANRVAHAIVAKRGINQEPIALLFEPDAAAIIAILGVLKSGKFYLQLKSSHPPARNNYIVKDAQAGLILTNNENFPLARELSQEHCQLLNIDELDSIFSDDDLGLSFSPDNLARIVYTSGSVGQPKGVVHSHRTLLHFRMEGGKRLEPVGSDRVAVVGLDIFTPLVLGATCFPWNVNKDGLAGLADWLIREEITVYRSFPTVFRHFVSTLTGTEAFPKLRLISLIGEPVYSTDVELYRKHFRPPCFLINNLGSTETGTYRQYVIDKDTNIVSTTIPAGYEVKDIEVLLLDDNGKEVKPGCIGEIAVKSRYLSLGYWHRPELTRAKFVADPNGGDERIYLTGDLGRLREDRCLECLGRKDFRVKIRGFTVDVGEVEAVLMGHPGVTEATIIAREAQTGDLQLVSYLVPGSKPAPTVSSLRRFLGEKLPSYMIPSAFVTLEKFPMLPTGKIDRRALPEPGNMRPNVNIPYAAPQTPIEEELAKIWAEVLFVDRVGIHDNFFDLGGHSLAATQVVSRVISSLQVELSAQHLLQAATVADMAAAILQAKVKELEPVNAASLLSELEALSDEEAQGHLSKK